MSTNVTDTADHNKNHAVDIGASPIAMHRPQHSVLDTEGTACLDEVLHEAALRESALRAPR